MIADHSPIMNYIQLIPTLHPNGTPSHGVARQTPRPRPCSLSRGSPVQTTATRVRSDNLNTARRPKVEPLQSPAILESATTYGSLSKFTGKGTIMDIILGSEKVVKIYACLCMGIKGPALQSCRKTSGTSKRSSATSDSSGPNPTPSRKRPNISH